ncbi:hypothetical protein NDU88_003570 [Pleurodeles waltl]|uniref:Uncharacterized protein n=1 Tax=Pleurodeles waltl TaxID=8319 RepID=A0AAV7LLZ9_PLEWA|nr:hypothetical protein NDU88_003570 [Pleurodeles waltl]
MPSPYVQQHSHRHTVLRSVADRMGALFLASPRRLQYEKSQQLHYRHHCSRNRNRFPGPRLHLVIISEDLFIHWAMPNGKPPGKRSHQLLFSEAIEQSKTMAAQTAPSGSVTPPADPRTMEATDLILQEITAVGRRLEEMDSKISDLTVASTSIRADIAGFRETVTDLDQHLMNVEAHVATLPDHEAELRSLRAKVTDLEDRSRRDNVHDFGIPEQKEGPDIKTLLKHLLLELAGLNFSSSLQFQRAHRYAPLHKATSVKPRPIIACFLRRKQA